MRFIQFVTFLSLLIIVSCKDSPERPEPILDESAQPATTITTNTVPPAPGNTAVAGNVPHYICPNNCEGGGGPSAGNCPVCGTAMVHNQAFHNQAQTTDPNAINTPVPTSPPTGATPPAGAEPAQNADGVWHYICSKGCPGGAGSAVACATCGGTLVHNSAYHQ